MFSLFKGTKNCRRLDSMIQRVEMNVSNNYKDAAQLNLRELEEAFSQMTAAGELSERQRLHYEDLIGSYRERLKNFTHRDQKPTWV